MRVSVSFFSLVRKTIHSRDYGFHSLSNSNYYFLGLFFLTWRACPDTDLMRRHQSRRECVSILFFLSRLRESGKFVLKSKETGSGKNILENTHKCNDSWAPSVLKIMNTKLVQDVKKNVQQEEEKYNE